jgi:hypothetical protein
LPASPSRTVSPGHGPAAHERIARR